MNFKERLKTAKKYVKKPYPIKAIKIDSEFEVKTPKGIMKGKPGDYLVENNKGKLYIYDGKIFEETYEQVDSYLKGVLNLNDKNKSILNLVSLSKYFFTIGDYDNKFFIDVPINDNVHRLEFEYLDKKKMLAEKEFTRIMLLRFANKRKIKKKRG